MQACLYEHSFNEEQAAKTQCACEAPMHSLPEA